MQCVLIIWCFICIFRARIIYCFTCKPLQAQGTQCWTPTHYRFLLIAGTLLAGSNHAQKAASPACAENLIMYRMTTACGRRRPVNRSPPPSDSELVLAPGGGFHSLVVYPLEYRTNSKNDKYIFSARLKIIFTACTRFLRKSQPRSQHAKPEAEGHAQY